MPSAFCLLLPFMSLRRLLWITVFFKPLSEASRSWNEINWPRPPDWALLNHSVAKMKPKSSFTVIYDAELASLGGHWLLPMPAKNQSTYHTWSLQTETDRTSSELCEDPSVGEERRQHQPEVSFCGPQGESSWFALVWFELRLSWPESSVIVLVWCAQQNKKQNKVQLGDERGSNVVWPEQKPSWLDVHF